MKLSISAPYFRRSLAKLIALFGFFYVVPVSVVQAHVVQVEPVEAIIRPRGDFLNAEFSGNIQDITTGVNVQDNERVGDHFTRGVEKRVEEYVNQHFVLEQKGTKLKGKLVALHYQSGLDPTQARYQMIFHYPRRVQVTGAKEAPYTFTSTLYDYLPNALIMVNIGGLQRKLASGQTVTVDPNALISNLLQNILDFWKMGVEHIFTGPDHILFILALLLVSPTLKSLIKTLTGFTIAHSITLILSTLSIITISPKLVDVCVALSIVYVGVENIFLKSTKHRFWIASGFGLVHGLAFANNLRDAGLPEGSALFWSLLAFNLGVETAQVLICCAAFPLLMAWKRSTEQRAKYGGMTWQNVVVTASGGVVLAGTYWLIQRAFGT